MAEIRLETSQYFHVLFVAICSEVNNRELAFLMTRRAWMRQPTGGDACTGIPGRPNALSSILHTAAPLPQIGQINHPYSGNHSKPSPLSLLQRRDYAPIITLFEIGNYCSGC